ncbi:hypothetical protein ACP4OV_016661 [Aristida adscensionis]
MEPDWGDIPCSVEQFWELVKKLNADKKDRIIRFRLGCMLQIRPIKMRPALLKFFINKYNPTYRKFEIRSREIMYISASDVQDIMGLKPTGLTVKPDTSLSFVEIPEQFHVHGRASFRIESLIADIVIHDDKPDDDFLRRFVLVMLGTVLAPVSSTHVPVSYYAIVKDVINMRQMDWNELTLGFLKAKFKEGQDSTSPRWPSGNLALLQYAYWEKVRPLSAEFDYSIRRVPLMSYWDEGKAYMRDKYDIDNGRGSGIVINEMNKGPTNFPQNHSDDDESSKNTPNPKETTSFQEVTVERLCAVEEGMSTMGKGMKKRDQKLKDLPKIRKCLEV